MEFNYIIIQAGGLGSRLGNMTKNKPKGLVSVKNLPIIFHMFKAYPQKKFIIIGDYKFDVLRKYLEIFSDVKYLLVQAKDKGTCGGIKEALKYINHNEPFLLTWSDLIFEKPLEIRKKTNNNLMGISSSFKCRWSFDNNKLREVETIENGVAGVFLFKNKEYLKNIPNSGEFVKWLKNINIDFESFRLDDVFEVGTTELIHQYEGINKYNCRPFNSIIEFEDKLIKKPITKMGMEISSHEKKWYEELLKHGYRYIPKIYSLEPLTMEKIVGVSPFSINASITEKKMFLNKIVTQIKELHNLDKVDKDVFSIYKNYYSKTIHRIEQVRNLIPFNNSQYITINGKKCKNIFFYKDKLLKLIEENLYDTKFALIHGDITFSNIIMKENELPIFIDPRGYFGDTLIYGDVRYDWAKLYYSIIGNYDQFNKGNFSLEIKDNNVIIETISNGWEELEEDFFMLIEEDIYKIKLIHAIIWLSLTTYTWDDYDSICAAFYYGIYYMEEFL